MQRLEHDDDELDENDDGLDDRCDKARALALKAAARVDAMANSILSAITTCLLSKVWSLACLETEGKDKRTLNIYYQKEKGVGRNSKERVLLSNSNP